MKRLVEYWFGRNDSQLFMCIHASGLDALLSTKELKECSFGLRLAMRLRAFGPTKSTLQLGPAHPVSHSHTLGEVHFPLMQPCNEHVGTLHATPDQPFAQSHVGMGFPLEPTLMLW